MSKSSVHNAHGVLRIGDGKVHELKNFDGGSAVANMAVNHLIANKRAYNSGEIQFGTTPFFRRHSKMRYDKDRYNNVREYDANNVLRWWNGYNYSVGEYQSQYRRAGQTGNVIVPVDYDVDSRPRAIGSMWAGYRDGGNQLAAGGPLPLNKYGVGQPFSWLDIPGVTIGNAFKHQADVPDARFFYVDTGDNALSQGDIEFGGHIDYPERLLKHYVYQAYVTKSGGTGTIEGAEKSNGETFPAATDNRTFKDATFNAFVVGDVGKYIAIRTGNHVGTYLITAYVDTATVETDAAIVNEAFANDTGVTWTLRVGPIGEYFWRRRPYTAYDRPTPSHVGGYGSSYMGAMLQEVHGVTAQSGNGYFTSIVGDGEGNYWCLSASMNGVVVDAENWNKGLCRYTQMSPQGYDPTYGDGDITDMPVGISYWRDLDADDQHFIWVAWQGAPNAPNADKRLAKINPYPGAPADARYPSAAGADSGALYEAQSGLADASGLCSDDPIGVLCDYENAVTWIFHDTGARLATSQDNGGISYTEDGGTTFKRLHRLHTIAGTVTVTNGSPNVSAGTDLTTNFAVGDWIRFGADTRSYEIFLIPTAATMTLAENYAGTETTGTATKKGALDDLEAIAHFGPWNTYAGRNTTTCYNSRVPCDFDRDGNIYWVSADRNLVCKWSPSDGRVYQVSYTDIPAGGSAFVAGQIRSLKVSRLPQFANLETHVMDENIWVGQTQRGIARIPKANFEHAGATGTITSAYVDLGGTPNKVKVTDTAHGLKNGAEIQISGTTSYNGFFTIENVTTDTFDIISPFVADGVVGTWSVVITRYSHLETDNWPLTVDLYGQTDWFYGATIAVDETSGQIFFTSSYHAGDHLRSYAVNMSDELGLVLYMGTSNTPTVAANYYEHYSAFGPALAQHYGRDGTSQGLLGSAYPSYDQSHLNGAIFHGPWTCYGWSGSAWSIMQGNQQDVDLDFDQSDVSPGPHVHDGGNIAPGHGTRRVHEGWMELEYGMTARFAQNGGVAQANEFVIDEQTTVPVYTGWGKDNISDAEYSIGAYFSPTILRQGVESAGPTANPWTSEGADYATMGVDGGWDPDSVVEGITPEWGLGVAEPATWSSRYYGFVDFVSLYGSTQSNPDAHFMACLRIRPELELANDGSVLLASPFTFTSAGGHTFVTGDIGKTIEIEGSVSSNNGSYVITAVAGASCTIASTIFNDEGPLPALRWKLIDIPAVGYVDLWSHYSAQPELMMQAHNWRLYSSEDRGEVWVKVKEALNTTACTDDQSMADFEDDGVIFSGIGGWNTSALGMRVIFDLTALDPNTRRKTYWKIWKSYGGGVNSGLQYSGLILRDDNFRILGAPALLKSADADDPQFVATFIGDERQAPTTRKLVLYNGAEFSDQIQSTDDGNGDGYTNLMTIVGTSFYEGQGTNGDTTAGGASTFKAVSAATATGTTIGGTAPDMTLTVSGATFEPQHVGKLVTIAGATTPANDGDFTITEVLSSTQVRYYNRAGVAEAYTGAVTLRPFNDGDIGKRLRIPGATPSGGGDYDGFVTVTSIVDEQTVGIDIDLNDTTGLTWALVKFGPGDRLFLDDDYFLPVEGAEVRDLLPAIVDVPTSTTLLLSTDSVPLASPVTVAVDFDIVREFSDGVDPHRPGATLGYDYQTELCGYLDPRSGVYFHSESMEFIELSSTGSCTTPADGDGDGRVDTIVVPTDLNAPGPGQVVPGDYIEVTGTGVGKRVFEIKSMTLTGSPTTVSVWLDELLPSLSGLTVRVLRRRFWRARTLKSTTVTQETIV